MDGYLTQEEKVLLLKVKECYDQVGTIDGVVVALKMQYSLVRQCLRKGHRRGLFFFDKYKIEIPPKKNDSKLIPKKESVLLKNDHSPFNYFVDEDVKKSLGLNPRESERELLLYVLKNPNVLKMSDPAKRKKNLNKDKNTDIK